jgi:hypothetical protein
MKDLKKLITFLHHKKGKAKMFYALRGHFNKGAMPKTDKKSRGERMAPSWEAIKPKGQKPC